jgi:hypothetical protein
LWLNVKNKFGWILSGAVEGAASGVDVNPNTALSNLIIGREIGCCDQNDDLKCTLRRFWETETIGNDEASDENHLRIDREKYQKETMRVML